MSVCEIKRETKLYVRVVADFMRAFGVEKYRA